LLFDKQIRTLTYLRFVTMEFSKEFPLSKAARSIRFQCKSCLTIELTWGETDYTQRQGKKTT
jgi:hypothetical protein